MPTRREITAEAVTMFTSWHDGFLAYREDFDKWAVICTDGKWRLVNTWDFDEFVARWSAVDYWRRIPCGPGSEFRSIVETLMVARPRLSDWKCDPFMRADDRVYEHCQINGLTQVQFRNEATPCPSCGDMARAYDTEPGGGHLTYAYECVCGNEWTEDMDHLLKQ